MVPDMPPLFGLRMKSSPSTWNTLIDGDGALDSLGVMTAQDSHYRCSDYFARNRQSNLTIQTRNGVVTNCIPEIAVDQICREKMCEWSYRVCDHFRTTREVVAFAFSFLDRFISVYNCDRTTFKLASMTAFFIATKLLNVKQISIRSLAELSRGEFNSTDIGEMEKLILQKLRYRMNPPTIQAFISYLRIVLAPVNSCLQDEIYQRAMFLAEICVYDYSFVTEERYPLAVACVLNAVEGIEDMNLAEELRTEYLNKLHTLLCVDIDLRNLDRIQKRLWYLYSCSAQIQYEDIVPRTFSKERLNNNSGDDIHYDNSSFSHSPVGVGFS